MRSCAGILLAGGQSRRMGQDKALLPFGTEAIATRLYRVLEAACPEVVVVRAPERGFPEPAARLVADRYPDRGPMEGIATGLEAIRSDRAIVVACDMPFVSQAILQRLIAFDPSAPIVIPRTERGLEPLLAVYTRSLLPELRPLLEAGERRVQAILSRLPHRELPLSELSDLDPDGRCFWNLNHPEAYRAALQTLSQPSEQDPGP